MHQPDRLNENDVQNLPTVQHLINGQLVDGASA
jgi:hypothetical protein